MWSDMAPKRSFTVAFKLCVVDYAEIHGKHQAARIHRVDRRRVQEWCGQREKLRDVCSSTPRSKRLSGGGRKVTFEDIEKKVLAWMNDRWKAGTHVTGKSL